MLRFLSLFVVIVIVVVSDVDTANILFVFPIPSRSHQIMVKELYKALIARGHHITMISSYPLEEKLENYTDVYIEGMLEYKEKTLKPLMSYNVTFKQQLESFENTGRITKITLDSPSVQKLLKSNQSFDLVIQELMVSEGLVGIGHHFKAPTIGFHVFGTSNEVDYAVGNSPALAYVPSVYAPLTDEMSFFERVGNVLLWTFVETMFQAFLLPAEERELHEHFPDAPPLNQLLRNISLVFVNAHYSVADTPRPYLPNIVPIGGLHIQPQKLPGDLKSYLDGATNGAVLFSLGSNVKSADLPKHQIDAILETFKQCSQKFLWKFEDDSLNVPENVKIYKWLPQRAVLNHPNVRAFVTHGGLLSISEAVYYGVPFVGIPAYGDQMYNMAIAAHRKIGIKVSTDEVTKQTLSGAIKEILENKEYANNIKRYSELFRDQPISPLDHAVYWVEHVIKYKGAPHLQNSGVRLTWYQSYLLDVAGFMITIVVAVLYMSYLISKRVFSCFRRLLTNTKKLKRN